MVSASKRVKRRRRSSKHDYSQKRTSHKHRKKFNVFMLFLFAFVTLSIVLFIKQQIIPQFFSVDTTANILIISHNDDFSEADVMYLHLNKQPEERRLYYFDPNEEVVVPGGYGRYALKSVFPLLDLDITKREMVPHFSQIFGVLFTDVVIIDREVFESITDISKELIFYDALKRSLTQQGSLHDMKILFHLQQLSQNKNEQISLYSTQESSQVYKSLFDQQDNQNCSLTIANATDVSGLARNVASVLERSDFYVIRVIAHSEKISQSVLYLDPKKSELCKPAISALETLFSSSITLKESSQASLENRADLVLFLGEETAKFFSR